MASPLIARAGLMALALAVGFFPAVDGSLPAAYAGEKDELSLARAKFQQATEMEQAGNFSGALQLFREVGQVRMTPQVRFHIATCEQKLGKLIAALGGYELALAEAESMGPEFQKEVEDRVNDLRSRIPKLVIRRGEGAEAATIELDGVALGSSSIGVEVPIDPGPHAIHAKAPGYKKYATTIDVVERRTERVTIELEKVPAEDDGVPPPVEKPIVPATPHRTSLVPYAIGAGAVAGVALIATSYFYFGLQKGKDSELQDLCGADGDCTNGDPRSLSADELSNAKSLNNKLHTYTSMTNVSLAITLIATAATGGLVAAELVMASNERKAKAKENEEQSPTETSWSLRPAAPGANIGGLSLIGNF